MSLFKRTSRNGESFVWHVKYRDASNKIKRVSTRTSNKTIAQRIEKKFLSDVALVRSGLKKPEPLIRTIIKVSDYKQIYSEYLKANGRQEGTVDLFNYALDSLLEVFDKRLDGVTPKDIENWKAQCVQIRTSTSINIYQRMLKAAFAVAKKLDYIRHNPWDDVEMVPPSYDSDVPKTFQDEEIPKLFAALAEVSQKVLFMTKYYLYTGMRREELIHSEIQDHDLDSGRLKIKNKPHYNWSTKTMKAREVPINDALRSVIEDMKIEGIFPGTGLVFKGSRSNERVNGNWLAKKFKEGVLKVGLDEELSIHNLRHTYATRLLQKGARLYPVSQLLGHSTVRTTEKYYSHAIPTDWGDEANLINYEINI